MLVVVFKISPVQSVVKVWSCIWNPPCQILDPPLKQLQEICWTVPKTEENQVQKNCKKKAAALVGEVGKSCIDICLCFKLHIRLPFYPCCHLMHVVTVRCYSLILVLFCIFYIVSVLICYFVLLMHDWEL